MSDPLLARALAYPGAWEDHPWEHTVVKVGKKIFCFLDVDAEGTRVTVKLPTSMLDALQLPNAEPSSHGLGRSGWVTARWGPDDARPDALIAAWIDESYRAIAPKKLIAQLA